MPVIPSDLSPGAPMFRVTGNGAPLPMVAGLIALDVRHDAGGAVATLRFAVSPADGGVDSVFPAAPLGATLVVALGYHEPLFPVFTGTVRVHRLQLSGGGAPEMVLEATSSDFVVPRDGISSTVRYGATLLAFEGERTMAAGGVHRQGRATLAGTTDAQPGGKLAVHGTGDGFDGELRIVAVHQQFSHEGWRTHVDVRSDDRTA